MPYWMLRKYPWYNFILLYKFILLVYNKRGGGSKEGGGIVWNKKVGRMFDNFSKTNKRGEGPHLLETREIKCNLSQIYIPYRIRYIKIRTSLNNFGLTSTATKNLLLDLLFLWLLRVIVVLPMSKGKKKIRKAILSASSTSFLLLLQDKRWVMLK